MFVVEVGGGFVEDVELTAVGVGATVGTGKDAPAAVGEAIVKFIPVCFWGGGFMGGVEERGCVDVYGMCACIVCVHVLYVCPKHHSPPKHHTEMSARI